MKMIRPAAPLLRFNVTCQGEVVPSNEATVHGKSLNAASAVKYWFINCMAPWFDAANVL
jgi:hypothetical protein